MRLLRIFAIFVADYSPDDMITLIAEAKTMQAPSDAAIDLDHNPLPAGEAVADDVMRQLLSMSVAEIASELNVSSAMASKILKMAYDFPLKQTSRKAILAFTGVVFKALSYSTLDPEAKDYIDRNVRIISSLYGWLRPDDPVKPYRLDYSTRLAPGDTAFSTYWRKDVTMHLVRLLKERHDHDIINLLPGDAEKCIDKKLVKGSARIWKVEFKLITDANTLRTPSSGRLKELRGTLLREMAERNITTPDQLKNLATPLFLPLGTPQYPDHILFATDH